MEQARGGRSRRRGRVVLVAALAVVLAAGGLAAAALLAWPHVRLADSSRGLARVELTRHTARVVGLAARSPDGAVPVVLRKGEIRPTRPVAAGETIRVEVVVERPRWIGWLVGRRERRTLTVRTPTARLQERWLRVKPGADLRLRFDRPVGVVRVGGHERRLVRPSAVVDTGIVVGGARSAGSVEVAAAARPWERLPAPVAVHWFPAQPYPQLLVRPRPGTTIRPTASVTLTFSAPVASVLGAAQPQLLPKTPGSWRQVGAHTLRFQPGGLGFGLGATLRVTLPRPVRLASDAGADPTRTLAWQVPQGSLLRLQQLLARLGWLPVTWTPDDPADLSTRDLLSSAVSPPPGRFTWRYPHTPKPLRERWLPGKPNVITRGAIMAIEDAHHLPVDGLAGPRVWRALLADAISGAVHRGGYSYVYVHRNVPQSLNLWHDGKVVLRSPGNTGVPAAPTQLGTFPVFEHIPVGTMSGTNPDGSHYNDPGVRWISYFNGGDALHAFPRASYGTPQSLGCVELPLDAAAKVWPYTPIGTLVTIEN